MVTDLIRATPEEDVLRRDIYDRPPIFRWTKVGEALGAGYSLTGLDQTGEGLAVAC
jgi:hypothetical protein